MNKLDFHSHDPNARITTVKRLLIFGSVSQILGGATCLGEGLDTTSWHPKGLVALVGWLGALAFIICGGLACKGRAPRQTTPQGQMLERNIGIGGVIQIVCAVVIPLPVSHFGHADLKLTIGLLTATVVLTWIGYYIGMAVYRVEAVVIAVVPLALLIFFHGDHLMVATGIAAIVILWGTAALSYWALRNGRIALVTTTIGSVLPFGSKSGTPPVAHATPEGDQVGYALATAGQDPTIAAIAASEPRQDPAGHAVPPWISDPFPPLAGPPPWVTGNPTP